MFKMRQQYANWADGVDQNISQKFISSAQNEDELAKEKMAKRYEEMERRYGTKTYFSVEPFFNCRFFYCFDLFEMTNF